jgi:hypothetical protein
MGRMAPVAPNGGEGAGAFIREAPRALPGPNMGALPDPTAGVF